MKFLQNNVFNVDIFAIEHGEMADSASSKGLVAPLGLTRFSLTAGETITADVVIQNKGIAHSHVPEQRDMYESWVEFTVKDQSGKVMHQSGFIKPNEDLDERAHSFTSRLVNSNGGLNDLHQVWDQPCRRIQQHHPDLDVPSVSALHSFYHAARRCRADHDYGGCQISPVRPAFYRYHYRGQTHYEQPIVDMASQTRTIQAGDNNLAPPGPDENKEWMRWNNFGIALLDAQQYSASAHAFERVTKLRPDYADAFTNVAIAQIQWQRYDEARSNIEKALTLAPGNARSLYYRALVERNLGNMDAAIADLQKVAVSFPQSRDAHRELGFSYYQLHKYDLARVEYENVQSIDPDDLAAHYILSIVYRRLGLMDLSAQQAAIFADQKDDPTASTYAYEFLQKHTEIANEGIVWHTHELDMPTKPGETLTQGSRLPRPLLP